MDNTAVEYEDMGPSVELISEPHSLFVLYLTVDLVILLSALLKSSGRGKNQNDPWGRAALMPPFPSPRATGFLAPSDVPHIGVVRHEGRREGGGANRRSSVECRGIVYPSGNFPNQVNHGLHTAIVSQTALYRLSRG